MVLLSIVNHHLRRPDDQAHAMGVLLGQFSEDARAVTVKNAFAVPLKTDADPDSDAVFLSVDVDYLKSMLQLHHRTGSKDVVVGFYSTGGAPLERLDRRLTERLRVEAGPWLPWLLHLAVDPEKAGVDQWMSAYQVTPIGSSRWNQDTPMGDVYLPMSCVLVQEADDRAALDLMQQARKQDSSATAVASEMSLMRRLLSEIQGNLKVIQAYVDKVVRGDIKGDGKIGAYLMETFAMVPHFDGDEFEQLYQTATQVCP